MKQIVLHIKDSKLPFFMELIRNFDFVQIQENDDLTKEQILAGIKQGLQEVQMIEEGKMKGTPLKDLLDEL